MMRNTIGFWSLVFVLNFPLWAQNQTPSRILAQKLADELLAKHQPELLYVGMHAVAQGASDMTIVAATLPIKIGQKSSCADLHVLSTGIPVLELKGGLGTMIKGQVIGSTVLAPLHDRKGNTIGMLNLGMKFMNGEESEAARMAKSILQELEGQIPNKPALFERTE